MSPTSSSRRGTPSGVEATLSIVPLDMATVTDEERR
jgi:hypothetical protein